MGLVWGKASSVKNGTMIVISAKLPEGKKAQEEFWNLWKLKKDQIKADGFGIGKDRKDNQWKINYFHTITEDSYEKTVDGEHMWKAHLDKKIKKWEAVLTNMRDFINEKTESEMSDTDVKKTKANKIENKTQNKIQNKKQNEFDDVEENIDEFKIENETHHKKDNKTRSVSNSNSNKHKKIELEYENNDDEDLAELEKILYRNKIK